MNRSRKIYILLTVFISLSSIMFAGDILDNYIGELLAKSEPGTDELLSVLDESAGKVKETAEKSEDKTAAAVKQADPNDIVKTQDDTADAKSVNTTSTEVKTADPNNTGSAILEKNKKLREKLKETSISSLPDAGNSQINDQLKDVLAQLKSLRFSENSKADQPQNEVSPKPEEAAPKPAVKADAVKSQENPESQSPAEVNQLTVIIPEGTSNIVDAFELAESLFHTGDKAGALKYYRKALDLTLPVGQSANPKRAWILFQIGNCLYGVDNIESIKIFEQLIQEHPNSEWVNCARTKKQVLKWLTVEKPLTLTANNVK